jgi:hypothetical protein
MTERYLSIVHVRAILWRTGRSFSCAAPGTSTRLACIGLLATSKMARAS